MYSRFRPHDRSLGAIRRACLRSKQFKYPLCGQRCDRRSKRHELGHYVDLAQAVSQQSFNEVWVAEGTSCRVLKSASFILPLAFRCTVGLQQRDPRTQRNAVANPTILSGDIGTQGNSGDNSYHVVVPSQVRPWMDSPLKMVMRAKTSAMTTGESGRVFTPTKPLSVPTVFGQPFPSKRRSRLPQGLQRDLRGL